MTIAKGDFGFSQSELDASWKKASSEGWATPSSRSSIGFSGLRRSSGASGFTSRRRTGESAFRSGVRSEASGFQNQSNRGLRSASRSFSRMGGIASSMAGTYGAFSGLTNDYITAVRGYNPQFLVDQAAMDARTSYDKSKGILERNMLRYGINPNSGRFAAMQTDWARALAAAEAGAKTKARRQVYLDRISTLGQAVGVGQSVGSSAMSGLANSAQGALSISDRLGTLAGDSAALDAYTGERGTFQDQLSSLLGQ